MRQCTSILDWPTRFLNPPLNVHGLLTDTENWRHTIRTFLRRNLNLYDWNNSFFGSFKVTYIWIYVKYTVVKHSREKKAKQINSVQLLSNNQSESIIPGNQSQTNQTLFHRLHIAKLTLVKYRIRLLVVLFKHFIDRGFG